MIRGKELKDIGTAIKLYYEKLELSNKDIMTLFDIKSDATVARLKKPVLEAITKQDIQRFSSSAINTKVAFEVWGIDIKKLEENYQKLKKLGFI